MGKKYTIEDQKKEIARVKRDDKLRIFHTIRGFQIRKGLIGKELKTFKSLRDAKKEIKKLLKMEK